MPLDEGVEALLLFNGREIEGTSEILQIKRAEVRFTSQDIFNFLEEFLSEKEELDALFPQARPQFASREYPPPEAQPCNEPPHAVRGAPQTRWEREGHRGEKMGVPLNGMGGPCAGSAMSMGMYTRTAQVSAWVRGRHQAARGVGGDGCTVVTITPLPVPTPAGGPQRAVIGGRHPPSRARE